MQKIITRNKEEENNNFKLFEKTIKKVKTKMSDILLKKKKETIKDNKTERNNNIIKSCLSNSPNIKNKKKLVKKYLSIGSENNNDNSLNLNSLIINPDETISKLNYSNNELIKKDRNLLKSDIKISKYNNNTLEFLNNVKNTFEDL